MKNKDVQSFIKNYTPFFWMLALLFLPPLGAYGMWRYTKWNRWLKIGLSVYAALFTLVLVTPDKHNSQPLTTASVAETNSSSPPEPEIEAETNGSSPPEPEIEMVRDYSPESEGDFYISVYKNAKQLGVPIDYFEETLDIKNVVLGWGKSACEAIGNEEDILPVLTNMKLLVNERLPYEDERMKKDFQSLVSATVVNADKILCPLVPETHTNELANSAQSITPDSTVRQIGEYFVQKYGIKKREENSYVTSPEENGAIELKGRGCSLYISSSIRDSSSLDKSPNGINISTQDTYFQSICAQIVRELLATYALDKVEEVYSQVTDQNALDTWREYQSNHNSNSPILFKNGNLEIRASATSDAEIVAINFEFQN